MEKQNRNDIFFDTVNGYLRNSKRLINITVAKKIPVTKIMGSRNFEK